jgi:uncharacterized protein (TIGR02145 family)
MILMPFPKIFTSKYLVLIIVSFFIRDAITAQTVTITSSAVSNTIIQGQSVTFTANVTGGSISDTYQWYKNGVALSGEINNTYTTNNLNNTDNVYLVLNGINGINQSGLLLHLDAGTSYPGSGNIWYDQSGNNNNATLRNGATYDANSGGSIVLNNGNPADSQYISVPQISTSITNITMQVWVYVSSSNTTGTFIKNGSSGGYGIGIGDYAYDKPGNNVVMLFSGVRWISTGVSYGAPDWKLVTMTLDGSSTPRAYVNGNLVGLDGYPDPKKPTAPSGTLKIGTNRDDGYVLYNGKFRAAYFYNRQLSQPEILANYNASISNINNLKKSNSITTTVIVPTVSISAPLATLTSNCLGVASASTTFGITGSNLNSVVTVSAPTGFEISTVSNTSYVSSLSLTPSISNTVSSTLYVRLFAGATIGVSGTITVASSGAVSQSRTVSSTITTPAPAFVVAGPYTICSEGTYAISLTEANSYNGWSASSNAITVNSAGYVTAGTVTGTYSVSYSDACAQTTSATVTVTSTSTLPAITDGLASYKFNNNPQGPLGSGNVIYMGYNGFNYSSTIRPTNTGFYRANNVSGSSAGSPTEFYIFRCTTCGTVSDNNNLSSVTIGSQVWTDKNLDVTTYRNGDAIPQVQDPSAWASLTTGAWCYYDNDPANGAIYGKLYNWYAVNDSRGLAPIGWHVPTDAEWTTLGNSLGGVSVAGGKMKSTGTTYWISPNTGATNSSGFSALPGGWIGASGNFKYINTDSYLWSSSINGSDATYVLLKNSQASLLITSGYMPRGFSVRLIKD